MGSQSVTLRLRVFGMTATETPEGVATDPHPDSLPWKTLPADSVWARGVQIAQTPTSVYLRVHERPYVIVSMNHEQWEALQAAAVRVSQGEET